MQPSDPVTAASQDHGNTLNDRLERLRALGLHDAVIDTLNEIAEQDGPEPMAVHVPPPNPLLVARAGESEV